MKAGTHTETIDQLNIALILCAAALAYYLPYETFVFAYAYLGPAHYLTQISWLHNRSYFLQDRRHVAWIAIPGLAWIVCLFHVFDVQTEVQAFIVWLSVVAAISVVLGTTRTTRLIIALVSILAGLLLITQAWWIAVLLVLLPTLIHVYLFTALFMLFGALKGKSTSGLVAVAMLLISGVALLALSGPPVVPQISPYFAEGAAFFRAVQDAVISALGLEASEANLFRTMRFIGFAYLYHYLNWFSKTKVIGWGEISTARAAMIIGLYCIFVALYQLNFTLGFYAALALSIAHVFLEFPLNVQSVRGILAGRT